MRLKEPVEFLYLSLMLRWERSAPPDNYQGTLDGEAERNTQISRFAYVLKKVAIGSIDRTFRSFERNTQRKDGKSYISKDASWMKEPYPLWDGWYFEGCTSLVQKQTFLENLTSQGLSRAFVACASDFVEGKSVQNYLPTADEEDELLKRIREKEEKPA